MNKHHLSIHRQRPAGIGWRRFPVGLAVCCCVLLGLPLHASAAGYATISLGQGSKMKVEWRDASTARFDLGTNAYSILRNGKLYMVTGGRVMSADMLKHMGRDKNQLSDAQAMQHGKPSLKGPLGSETIAGIRGNVYKLTFGGRTGEVVLTDNPLVKQLTRVWIAYASSMGGNSMVSAKVMRQMFNNKGELRSGNNFHLVSINGNTPPASDFVLPAKPSAMPAMPNMSSMFSGHAPAQGAPSGQYHQQHGGNGGNGQYNQAGGGNAGNGQSNQANDGNAGSTGNSSGGFLDSIRNKFKQAEQRQSNHVDNKITQKTDNVVDHAVDNVLNHLFGN